MKTIFSRTWNKSIQARKQRKYRQHAPLHIKRKFVSVHLSKDLRKKYDKRNVILRKGDTIKILRGRFKTKTGKVDNIDTQTERIYINGIEIVKKDGTKTRYPIHPTNLIITELNTDDKMRQKSLKKR